MAVPNPVDPAAVVRAFPEFHLEQSPLGEGGTKSAYRIVGGNSRVLKLVRDPIPDDALEGAISIPERIRREIEAMRAISHPGIVQILDGPEVRQVNDCQHLWYIEPLYPGGTLADRLTEPLPEGDCLDLLSALVDAADALAGHRTVHRDIKPTNIVFDDSDRPVLLDLGIAYFQELTPLTESQAPSPKTLMYAAPEQFTTGRYTKFDFRTDLFLIGIVIFQALTGQHPFLDLNPEQYAKRLATGTWDGTALDHVHASPGIRAILSRLLDPSMSRRYRTIEHLRAAIEECR